MKRITLLLCLLTGLLSVTLAQTPCPSASSVGSASNIYTQILTEANPLAVNPELNTLVYVHRNDASQFGGHSGQFRYDFSTNGGANWTLNQGVLNPTSTNGVNAARYPNAVIYNPPNNSVPGNAYLAYLGATVATTWNGNVNGVRRLDGSGNTETYNQPAATQTLIPRSLVAGAPGVFWSIDAVYNGTNVLGFRVYRGDWNAASNDIDWVTDTTLVPAFNTNFDGNEHVADYQIDFDPSGQYGWICIQTHLAAGAPGLQFYPVYYRTTDGGLSWTGPEEVNLNQFSCITSNIAQGNVATTAFDMDLVVDKNGNPHCLTVVGQGPNSYSIFFTLWLRVFDFTYQNGAWNAIELARVNSGRGTWGFAPNEVTMDHEPQCARSGDGSRLFFFWTNSDSALSANNDRPNLNGIAYDVDSRSWTNPKDFSTCNSVWRGDILYPKAAELALNISGGHSIPVVFAELNSSGSALDPATFHFLDDVNFLDSEYVNTQCSVLVNLSQQDTLNACGSLTLTGPSNADEYNWSNGATSQSIVVSQSGMYWLGVQDACCTGGDSVYVIVEPNPQAGFASSPAGLTVALTDTSNGLPTTWFWDFGDGNTSTLSSPTHTYAAAGTYTVCLTVTNACGTDSTCQAFTVACVPPQAAYSATTNLLSVNFTDGTTGSSPTTWFWDFGDGNNSSSQNPTHSYNASGSYWVCLTVANVCNSSQFCDSLTVFCPPPAAGFSFAQQGQTGTFSFTEQATGSPTSYFWDFGDGNSSTMQNPIHTYSNSGLYTVCLIVNNTCGSDTSCQTVNLILDGRDTYWLQAFELGPIPASEMLLIRGELALAEPMEIRIVDLSGKVLKVGTTAPRTGFEEQISVGDLSAGMYFLELTQGKKSLIRRFLKE